MVKYEELYVEVKKMLSEKRFKHSEGVVKRAIEYAEIYNVDIETVKLAAIAHDIAKELSSEAEQDYIRKYGIVLDEVEKVNHNLLHAIIGAEICKDRFGFSEDMANSVRFHTTGRANMSMLEKVIYLADATEEGRNYEKECYVDTIKQDIDKGMVEVCKWVIMKLVSDNKIVHIDSVKCFNYYVIKTL